MLHYYSNCFRPFSSQEGTLAIDARKINGNITIREDNRNPFKIIYTIQGSIEVPLEYSVEERYNRIVAECLDSIPDRQGLLPLRTMGDQKNNSDSIVTIGDTIWQKNKTSTGIAAFKEIDLNNISYAQANLSQLANNWQIWQKTARKRIRDNFFFEAKIRPIICSNSLHEKTFHPNGLQISKDVEQKLLNSNPDVRKSIDWLGISLGKK